MRDAECVPEHDVRVIDGCVFIRDPFWDSSGGLAGCLGNVAAGGVDLLVVVCIVLGTKILREGGQRLTFGDVHGVPCESGSLPDQGTLLRKKLWHFSAHELVANWLVAIWIYFVGVRHIPCSGGNAVVVTD